MYWYNSGVTTIGKEFNQRHYVFSYGKVGRTIVARSRVCRGCNAKKLNDDKIFISSIGLLFNINNVTMDKNSHVLYESSKRIEQHRDNTKNGPRDDDKNE